MAWNNVVVGKAIRGKEDHPNGSVEAENSGRKEEDSDECFGDDE